MGEYQSDTMPGGCLAGGEVMKLLYLPDQYAQQRQREKKRWIWPVHLAMEATKMRNDGHSVLWDYPQDRDLVDKVITEPEGLPFLSLPHADRVFTRAYEKKYQNNGNFKHHPGTYIQSASGCWWGRCCFCKESGKVYDLRPVDDVISEIIECQKLGYREIFDDSASLSTGPWLSEFLEKLKPLGIAFSCNMRFDTNPDYKAMKDAGFRMLLFGLESANQKTLDKVNKGIKIENALQELIIASLYGLEPHVAVMFGYPWETDEDAIRTLKLVHFLLRKGYAKTAQASLYNVPGVQNKMFQKYVPQIYRAALYPDFWMNKLKDIRGVDDIKYIWRGIKSCFGI
jgi:radical SAM superfamily enzyme YgiQ (UPF0313 family)